MSSKLWGGAFASQTDPLMEAFGRSLHSDRRLVYCDLKVCQAHLQMLQEAGVVPVDTSARLRQALQAMEQGLASGQLSIEGEHEDIHSWVEAELKQRCGEEASLIRLGRSRNDLVVTDFRLWVLQMVPQLRHSLSQLQQELVRQAEAVGSAYLPGYTHLQRAQPVALGHHLLAHFWSFERDQRRLERCREEADCCPLGAGALAGSSWPINPQRTAELLGFSRAFQNSLDAVSDRDFAVELLSAVSIVMLHLSRMSEELILWSAPEFGFATFDDAWSTGSSLMPQKKNPDPAELIRGRSGRVLGQLYSLMVTLKGLPLAYNRDLQEDKPPVFEAVEMTDQCLQVMAGVIRTLRFHPERMQQACEDPGLLATDLADHLVRAGQPFHRAHELAGKWVSQRLDAAEQALVQPHLDRLSAPSVLAARSHPGAAGPQSVQAQLAEARQRLNSAE